MSRSLFYKLMPFIKYLRLIKNKSKLISFRKRAFITTIALGGYVLLSQTKLFGISEHSYVFLDKYGLLLGSFSGSMILLGTIPWAMSSIILLLFSKTNIFKLDLKEDKELYRILEYYLFPLFFTLVLAYGKFWSIQGNPFTQIYTFFIFLAQLLIGTYLLMLLADLINCRGIGYGINWFLTLSISYSIVWQLFSISPHPFESNQLVGAIPDFIFSLFQNTPRFVRSGPSIFGTWLFLLFLIIAVYVEGSRVELPLVYKRIRGSRGRYTLPLIYAGPVPIILAVSLMINVGLVSSVMDRVINSQSHILLIYTNKFFLWLSWLFTPPKNVLTRVGLLQGLSYSIFFILFCVFFSKFWVETTGKGPEEVAMKLQRIGMQIPGFRRDSRILKKVLYRYIPALTIMSGVFSGIFGILNVFGNPIAGTASFLLVATLIMIYEEVAREQAIEIHPVLRKFLKIEGGDE